MGATPEPVGGKASGAWLLQGGASRADRFVAPARNRPAWIGGAVSLGVHVAGAALAMTILTAPPGGLPPGGEVVIEVELIAADALESAASRAGASGLGLPSIDPPALAVVDGLPVEGAGDPSVALPPDIPEPAESAAAADMVLPPLPDAPAPEIPPLVARAEPALPLPPEIPLPEPKPAAASAEPTLAAPANPPPASAKPVPPARAAQSPRVRAPRAEAPRAVRPARTSTTQRRTASGKSAEGTPAPVATGLGRAVAGDGEDATSSTASLRGGTGGLDMHAGRAAFASFQGQVLAHLARHKRYPEAARLREVQGRVLVAFSLDAAGRVTGVSLARSSGHVLLDQETLAMVRRASPFPRIPPESGRTDASFTAPIDYAVR